jgi:hypothetical protein
MRAFLVVLSVVATLLLGVIAVELYPIARVASSSLSLFDSPAETRAARNARLKAETRESNADLDAIFSVARETPARRTPPAPPVSTTPTHRP